MTDLCQEYGIHRQTGYEVLKRYEEAGFEGLLPRSKAPKHIPHRSAPELAELVVEFRKAHPSWGPKKLKAVIERERGVRLPAASTIGSMIDSRGLAEPRRKRTKYAARPSGLRDVSAANELWCADYKGQFRLGDGSYCYPLTITDQHSRFILVCDGMHAIDDDAAQESSLLAFRKHGLPLAIRTDNGVPFASQGLAGMTRLSVLWLRLGIELERIKPENHNRTDDTNACIELSNERRRARQERIFCSNRSASITSSTSSINGAHMKRCSRCHQQSYTNRLVAAFPRSYPSSRTRCTTTRSVSTRPATSAFSADATS